MNHFRPIPHFRKLRLTAFSRTPVNCDSSALCVWLWGFRNALCGIKTARSNSEVINKSAQDLIGFSGEVHPQITAVKGKIQEDRGEKSSSTLLKPRIVTYCYAWFFPRRHSTSSFQGMHRLARPSLLLRLMVVTE